MTAQNSLSVLILTANEEKNIDKCLASIKPINAKVFIIDSLSKDHTVEIAESMGATVLQRPWTTYAEQYNWGLDNAGIKTPWVMRMDADEEITPELADALNKFLMNPPDDISGLYVRRRVYFMGQWIRHGGYYPTWLLRIFRNGLGRCETLFMDEHIVVSEGKTISIHEDIIDKNNKDLTFWTEKHNGYASREVKDILNKEKPNGANKTPELVNASMTGHQDSTKRLAKDNLYLRLPLFIRPFLYFIYRYFIKLGFLDGKRGLIFHFLQAFWYRFLVDAKLYEYRLQEKYRSHE
ncbi:MAG: glycosyltransferase family 2 protein [Gammaproteobacteria bacterium]|nr:glycosyltransferase family 2 protein [Gammaproteobacteria bacterium]